MAVDLHAKFEVSSMILTSFRQRGKVVILPPPPPPPQNEPAKRPPRLGLRYEIALWVKIKKKKTDKIK